MRLQSEMKYSLPPHVETVLHYRQRGNSLFTVHTPHASAVCKHSRIPLSNLKRERHTTRLHYRTSMLVCFYTTFLFCVHAFEVNTSLSTTKAFHWLPRVCYVDGDVFPAGEVKRHEAEVEIAAKITYSESSRYLG